MNSEIINSSDLNSWKDSILNDGKANPLNSQVKQINFNSPGYHDKSSGYYARESGSSIPHRDIPRHTVDLPAKHSHTMQGEIDYTKSTGHKNNSSHVDGWSPSTIPGTHSDKYFPPSVETGYREEYYSSGVLKPGCGYYSKPIDNGYYINTVEESKGEHRDEPAHNQSMNTYNKYAGVHSEMYFPSFEVVPHEDIAHQKEMSVNYYEPGYDKTYPGAHNDLNNYVPNAPNLFRLETSQMPVISGQQSIVCNSFDGNQVGWGTQREDFKKVEYKIEIRRIMDLNGNVSVSSWKYLQDFNVNDSISLNCDNPLNDGNTGKNACGTYEIRATARNPQLNLDGRTYTFESDSKVVKVKIDSNEQPSLIVTNPNEFIDFTFGPSKSYKNLYDLKNYYYMYSNHKNNNLNGIFVDISMTDVDKENWLKGSASLLSPTGSVLTSCNIKWSNGTEIIKSDGVSHTGSLFFNISSIPDGIDLTKCVIEISVRDYKEPSCSSLALSTLVQRRVTSSSSSQLLNVNLDKIAPSIETNYNTAWTNKDLPINYKFYDKSGIRKPSFMKTILSSVDKMVRHEGYVMVEENGTYQFSCSDLVGNYNSQVRVITNIDKVPPVIDGKFLSDTDFKPLVTDALSGVKTIWYCFDNRLDSENLSYFSELTQGYGLEMNTSFDYLHIKAMDNAGNISYKRFETSEIGVSATITKTKSTTYSYFKKSEFGSLNVDVKGKPDKLVITFPVGMEKFNREVPYSEVINNKYKMEFQVPNNFLDGNYRVNVKAVKSTKYKESNPSFEVKESVAGELRTRIK